MRKKHKAKKRTRESKDNTWDRLSKVINSLLSPDMKITPKRKDIQRKDILIITIFVLFYLFVVIKDSWLSDDAYITFRTIDNFINGYGLRWNIGERVQTYTSPLWMFLLSGLYFFTREIFYTSIVFSVIVSLVTILLIAFKIAIPLEGALLAIGILISSKAFVDYSTSGLENPMIHLMLALFFLFWRGKISLKRLFTLSLIAGISAFNRMDILILLIPPLFYAFLQLKEPKKGIYPVIIGFLPFILWECFSLFYYGFPFPNTAYAKLLNTGVSEVILKTHGFYYLINSFKIDPLTLLIILIGIISPFFKKDWYNLPISISVILYIIYIVKIGGDFMSGRFLTAPLFLAVCMIFSSWPFSFRKVWTVSSLCIILLGFISPYSPLCNGINYGKNPFCDNYGVADERSYYYQGSSFIRSFFNKGIEFPAHYWIEDGKMARREGASVIVKDGIGYFGFFAGPKIHIVDPYALGDPLCARLPTDINALARIGHFPRKIPEGYIDTLTSGKNVICDKNLSTYYQKLSIIIQGKLFDIKRLVEIWKMNIGEYKGLIDAYSGS